MFKSRPHSILACTDMRRLPVTGRSAAGPPAPVAAGGSAEVSVAGWGHARGRGGRAGGGGGVIS